MINYETITNLLKQMNIPFAYNKFQIDENNPPPSPPFILYVADDEDNFFADNKNYYNSKNFIIDLVTDFKDIELESKLEALFFNANIPYEKEGDNYIDNEKIYQIRYLV